MYDLYTWTTANSQKVNIAMYEFDLAFEVHPIDIGKREQFAPEFLALNPNHKVPVLHDREESRTIIESGAILLYLADREEKLLPRDTTGRWEAIQWVFWQMAGLGPTAGQLNYFSADPARGEHARARFAAERDRLLDILEHRLGESQYLVGSYSIADICIWPGISRFDRLGVDLTAYPNILRWYLAIAARPAVLAGVRLLQPDAVIPLPKGSSISNL